MPLKLPHKSAANNYAAAAEKPNGSAAERSHSSYTDTNFVGAAADAMSNSQDHRLTSFTDAMKQEEKSTYTGL